MMTSEFGLFPHDSVRPIQDELIRSIKEAISSGSRLVVHAPTGLGKTAASISPAIEYALDNNKTIFFLTSRHTQHKIAIDTLKEIKKKHDVSFSAADIVGKKHMCIVPGIELLYSGEFSEFCKAQREEGNCAFYSRTRKSAKLTVEAEKALDEMRKSGILDVNEVVRMSKSKSLCAYEMAIALSSKSNIIISDYNYVFNRNIRDNFLGKIEKTPEELIIIIDEAHNLPDRVKEMATQKVSSLILKRALKEAAKYQAEEVTERLLYLEAILRKLSNGLNNKDSEKKLDMMDFKAMIDKRYDYEEFIANLEFFSSRLLESEKKSSSSSIVSFLEAWPGQDNGYLRMIEYKEGLKEPLITLSYKCLDPSIITADIINKAHSTIMMSGTLTPTTMYAELAGMDNYKEKVFNSPFPTHNRINLIIPKTTTKYQNRSDEQYRNIAKECAKITDLVPGNSIIFFPSYHILDEVRKYFVELNKKTVFFETKNLDKNTKNELLENFKEYKDEGAVLLAVVSGSFGEGIDLPGDLLKGVVIVGLPLSTPDLETKSLIEYFDKKFGKGWEYGYNAPALNKVLQNAGRCIRSEKDRGMIFYLDERYAWSNYRKYLPNDKSTIISSDYEKTIKEFFNH